MHLIYLFVLAWFLLSVLASNVGAKRGYFGWVFFLGSVVSTVAVVLISAKAEHLEAVAPFAAWVCPLLMLGIAATLPARPTLD